jgi:hypothetical protein
MKALRLKKGTTEPYVACGVPRDAEGCPCKCNGYADRQDEDPTDEEIKQYDCGKGYACCTAVFVCRLCGKRFIGQLATPSNY